MPTTTYAASPIQLEILADFTGGLNLRADAFQLGDTESPDLLNVDLDPRGGFSMRDGTSLLNATALGSTPANMWEYSTVAGVQQVLVQQGNDMAYSTGANFTAINPDALTTTGKMRAATMKNVNVIQRNAENAACSWDGTNVSVLGTAFNENLAAPAGGNIPKAKCITMHRGYMFVANTVETAVVYGSRVRWSHPNFGLDWRTLDYIDVDPGHDGDQITAIQPFGDALLIFKTNSVYMLSGYSPETFSVNLVSDKAGAISQEAVTATEFGVYFFSWPNGLMQWTPKGGVTWAFERLFPAIANGSIPTTYQGGITVSWINRRVWVSVPWLTSTVNARIFVLDPSLVSKKRGAAHEGGWVVYDLPLSTMMKWQPPGAAVQWLGCHAGAGHVIKLHQTVTNDTLTTAAGVVQIASYYKTRWVDAGNPAVKKRWKRPEIIMRGGNTATIRMDLWHDFDPSEIKRTMSISTVANSTALAWDDDATPGADGTLDDNEWGAGGTDSEVIQRLSSLGRSRAVQMMFTGPSTTSVDWTIDAIAIKFIPRRLRG